MCRLKLLSCKNYWIPGIPHFVRYSSHYCTA